MKSTSLLLNDIRLRQRNGIYYAYGFVLLACLSLLYFLGAYFPSWALGILVYTDPAMLGVFAYGNINWPLYMTAVIVTFATFVSIGFPIVNSTQRRIERTIYPKSF